MTSTQIYKPERKAQKLKGWKCNIKNIFVDWIWEENFHVTSTTQTKDRERTTYHHSKTNNLDKLQCQKYAG